MNTLIITVPMRIHLCTCNYVQFVVQSVSKKKGWRRIMTHDFKFVEPLIPCLFMNEHVHNYFWPNSLYNDFISFYRKADSSYFLLPDQSLFYTWDEPSEFHGLSWKIHKHKKLRSMVNILPKVNKY